MEIDVNQNILTAFSIRGDTKMECSLYFTAEAYVDGCISRLALTISARF